MGTGEYNLMDPKTGKRPTRRQLEVLAALNPLEEQPTHQKAATRLGISRQAVAQTMSRLKRRCPEIYRKFTELKKGTRIYEKKMKRLEKRGWLPSFDETKDFEETIWNLK